MQTNFNILSITRNNLLEAIEDLSHAQLNQVSEGFNNSIIWNTAHILVTQQLLCYTLSGMPCKVDQVIIDKYRKDTNADEQTTVEEITYLKKMLLATTDLLQEDYKNKYFGDYKTYTTSYNITLTSIEDAIAFNNVHEGLHLGYIMAQKHTLK